MIGIGMSSARIKQELFRLAPASLLNAPERERYKRLAALFGEVRGLAATSATPTIRDVASLLWRHRKVLREDVVALKKDRGLFSTAPLAAWLKQLFGDRKMGDADAVAEMRFVAADVKNRQFIIYGKRSHPQERMVDAILASASIPMFFQPTGGESNLVDGGILSNYPSFLFANDRFPTIGFRLRDVEPPANLETLPEYLRALFLTMAEAHDRFRTDPPHYYSVEIPTPRNIGSTKFDLSADELEAVFDIGEAVGKNVSWQDWSVSGPMETYLDPKPAEVLRGFVGPVKRLYEKVFEDPFRIDHMEREARHEVWIDSDFSTIYTETETIAVDGTKPLIFWRRALHPSYGGNWGEVESIVDMQFRFEHFLDGAWHPVIAIPAGSVDLDRAFLYILSPPIVPGTSRTLRTTFSIRKEFAINLGKHSPAKLEVGLKQKAQRDLHSHIWCIYLADALSRFRVEPKYAHSVIRRGKPERDENSGKTFTVHEFSRPKTQIQNHDSLEVEIHPNY